MKFPNFIAIDLETTDSNYQLGNIIQIGALKINSAIEIEDRFKTYIRPLTDYRNPRAMEVNKILEAELIKALDIFTALKQFEEFVDGIRLLAAWGNYFDVPFLQAEYKKINREYPFVRKSIDLKSIAVWEFAKRNVHFSGGLVKALNLMDLKFEGRQHDALDDIVNTIKLMKSFRA